MAKKLTTTKGPKDATFAKQPRRPPKPFVDPRGTLEQRIDQLSDRVRKLEHAIEQIAPPAETPFDEPATKG